MENPQEPLDAALDAPAGTLTDLQWAIVNGILARNTLAFDDILWNFHDGRWMGMSNQSVHSFVRSAIYGVVRSLPEDQQTPAKRVTANVRLRKPIVDTLLGVLRARPKVIWNATGRAAAEINGKLTVFDFHTGERRSPRATDYINDISSFPFYTVYDRGDFAVLPESIHFLLDVFAYALHGTPTDRIYYIVDTDDSEGRHTLRHVKGMMEAYAMRVSHNMRIHLLTYASTITSSRMIFMEQPCVDDIRTEWLQDLTNGSGSMTWNGETHRNTATIFFHAQNDTVALTDPLILSRLVYIKLPISTWPKWSHIIAYLYDRAMEVHAPPPIPASIQEESARVRVEWGKIPFEEWLKGALVPAEGITKQAAWESYQVACGRCVRLENVSRIVFHHLMEEKVGPTKKVRGVLTYSGWTLKI
jgi:hypothetical protein